MSNAEEMAEPNAPKNKTQELDKAIKEVKKQKPKFNGPRERVIILKERIF